MAEAATPEASNKELRKKVLCKKKFFKGTVGFTQAGGDLSLGSHYTCLQRKPLYPSFLLISI